MKLRDVAASLRASLANAFARPDREIMQSLDELDKVLDDRVGQRGELQRSVSRIGRDL